MSETYTRRGGPAIGLAGRAPDELAAGAPPALWRVPDHHQSEYSLPGVEVRAATSRGLMHRHAGTERQDEYSVTWHAEHGKLLVVVCDGVGSREHSGIAAAHVCAELPARFSRSGDLAFALEEAHDSLATRIESEELTAATTVVACAVQAEDDGLRVDVVRVGDSSAWALAAGQWRSLSSEQPDGAVHSTRVHALPSSDPGIEITTHRVDGPVFLMTDGVSGPLSGSDEVRATLADWWGGAPHVFEFGAQVAFGRKTHMDDRTVVGVWPIRDVDRRARVEGEKGERDAGPRQG